MMRFIAPGSIGVGLSLAVSVLSAQQSPACNPQRDFEPRKGSSVAMLHPARVEERYASLIERREWRIVVSGFRDDVDSLLQRLTPGEENGFTTLSATLRRQVVHDVAALDTILDLPISQRAAALLPLDFPAYEPTTAGGVTSILEPREDVREQAMSLEQFEAICWTSRSMWRLLNAINGETIPMVMARIDALAGEWTRYRNDALMQLPHELFANRVWRQLFGRTSHARYHPPRVDLVVLHPFAGIELARAGGGVRRTESVALQLGGLNIWYNGWRNHLGASAIVAYDEDGRIGRGALLHVSGYIAAGMLTRRDPGGTRRKSFILSIDALRVLKPDAAAQARRQTLGVAGGLLRGG